MVEWQIVGLGCNLCRHFCPFPSLKHVQQQTVRSRPKSKSTITSPPMHTIPSHLLPSKLLECVALAPCLSYQTWVAELWTSLVTKALWHTSCKVFCCHSEGECCIYFGNFASNPLSSECCVMNVMYCSVIL